MEKVARDGVDRQYHASLPGPNMSTAPLLSPITTFTGPHPPYSSATPSSLAALEYISPPCSRRTTVDDKTYGPRQSLPSIQEALGDSAAPFSAPNISHPLSATARGGQPTPNLEPRHSFPEAPAGPPNPFSQGLTSGHTSDSYNHPPNSTKVPVISTDQAKNQAAFPALKSTKPLPASLHPLDTKTAEESSTYARTPTSYHPSPYQNGHGAGAGTSPGHFPPYTSSYAYPADSSASPSSTFPPAPDASRFNPAFKFGDGKQSIPRSHASQPYSESVKHHLDVFDIEMALNDVTDGASQALDFARTWGQRTHHRQRNGQLPSSLPSLPEVDDLMRQSSRVTDAFGRIKEAVIAQEHVLAEEQARAQREQCDGDLGGYPNEHRDSGAFPEGDSKKRRGKAAPPGRCHSCNRAETPEWRRGPDGARTLCNACGLHYAKLTRKMAVNKNAALSGSSLRPKNSEAQPSM